jgi:4a-hydroxytetrahydrobiopterin dehydratase
MHLQQTGGAWKHEDKALTSAWSFQSFQQAFNFMTLCADHAERLNHHPEWSNTYNRVSVRLTTHDAGGLTALDVELAQSMQALADSLSKATVADSGTNTVNTDAEQLVQQWMAAFNQEQLQTISECYAQDALLWGTHALQWIHGRDGVTQYFKNVFDSGRRVRVSLSGLQSWQAFDARIAHGSYRFESRTEEGTQRQDARFSFVWRRSTGAWRLQSHHSSVMPLQA